MLTSIDPSMFSSSSILYCRFIQLRKYSPNSRCRPSSCLLDVLAMFLAMFLPSSYSWNEWNVRQFLKVFLEAIFRIFPWNFMLCFKKNTCSTSVKLPSVKSHAVYFLKKKFICNKNLKYSRNLTFLWVWSLSCHITFFEKTRVKFILWPWSLATRLLSTFSTKLWQCVKIYTNGNILHCKM